MKSEVPLQTSEALRITDEFWTAAQRQANPLHEIAYRACFKPQLPAYFIEACTQPGEVVYDPFGGRGTTAIEAGLRGRHVISNDLNPLSEMLTRPRFFIPDLTDLEDRLLRIPRTCPSPADISLSMFYHPDTLNEILGLREYLRQRRADDVEDEIDQWIRMVATNRLTGHSTGFFSVYTLPPNQAVSPQRQKVINQRLRQKPEYRDTHARILRKSKSLVKSISPETKIRLRQIGQRALFTTGPAQSTPAIAGHSVQLVVTSPHFLDVVQYADDNWLRCWFNHISPDPVDRSIRESRTLEGWTQMMRRVIAELVRVVRPGGHVAVEVGEVRKQKICLDEIILPVGMDGGLEPVKVMINRQTFSKTANIWGIRNNRHGTNTNRIVLFRRP